VEHGLHETSVKDCLAPSHLPKIEQFHDVFFILTRYIDDNAPDEGSTVQELTNKVAMFVSKKTVLSIHRRLCPFIDKLKLNWDSKYSKSSIEHLTNSLMEYILLSYDKHLHNEEIIDRFEQLLFSHDKTVVKRLYLLKRRASVFKRMLRITKENLAKYIKLKKNNPIQGDLHPAIALCTEEDSPGMNENVGALRASSIIHTDHRVSTDAIIQHAAASLGIDPFSQDLLELADSLFYAADEFHEAIANLLNLHLALASHKTNELASILTTFSVFFIPPTFIAGVYGMNFDYMPELTWMPGYPVVISLMVLIMLVLYVWFVRRGFIHNRIASPFKFFGKKLKQHIN